MSMPEETLINDLVKLVDEWKSIELDLSITTTNLEEYETYQKCSEQLEILLKQQKIYWSNKNNALVR